MKTHYLISVRKTVNTLTGKAYYYKKKCGEFTRITKAEFLECCSASFGLADIFIEKSKNYKKIEKVLSFYL